ncbi:DUF6527 family protein [Variovorax sp. Root434]|uniref:DUF6527 family protein n=1 Tax=Variovorax sp. Root434 TaxID=1736536 RepID=UPI0006F2337E|nr:DUF6527 family protein [Variovorax sp. Root434]KQX22123.1 hypothetical protein ASD05_14315 [Variovorax sp. Root434]
MNKRVNRLAFKAQVEQRHEANPLLKMPGDAALVHRGVLRSLVMACPDGCGELLTINLDARSGKAWRTYGSHEELSLFPSVWRQTGCKSHFILWRSKIYWCDWDDELDTPMADVVELVRGRLSNELVPYVEIADALQLVPWAVLSACYQLIRKGLAQEGKSDLRGHFRRAESLG